MGVGECLHCVLLSACVHTSTHDDKVESHHPHREQCVDSVSRKLYSLLYTKDDTDPLILVVVMKNHSTPLNKPKFLRTFSTIFAFFASTCGRFNGVNPSNVSSCMYVAVEGRCGRRWVR